MPTYKIQVSWPPEMLNGQLVEFLASGRARLGDSTERSDRYIQITDHRLDNLLKLRR